MAAVPILVSLRNDLGRHDNPALHATAGLPDRVFHHSAAAWYDTTFSCGGKMNDYGPATYGDRIAEFYDRFHPGAGDATAQLRALTALAAQGAALELGIGTGRVAIPLAEQGVAVHGIDASEAMIDKLRTKPGGASIPVTIGDFSEVPVDGTFALIFAVFNTFYALTTQEDQVRCFQRVARRLADGGVFLIEVFVPDPARFTRGQSVGVTNLESDRVTLDVARHDPLGQRVDSRHLVLSESGTRIYPVQLRYAWPSELDLMARLAGLRLRDRWSDWTGAPFTAASSSHISLYERSPAPQ